MDENSLSDEQLLWLDTISDLEGQGTPSNLVAMMRGCRAVALREGVLEVEAPNSFAHRRLLRQAEAISAVLSQVAFEPMDVSFREATTGHEGPSPMKQAAPTTSSDTIPVPTPTSVVSEQDPRAGTPQPAQTVASVAGGTPALTTEPVVTTAQAPITTSEDGIPAIDWSGTSISPEQFRAYQARQAGIDQSAPRRQTPKDQDTPEDMESNPLIEEVSSSDAKLTFETFVEAAENVLALDAAKLVANGEADKYNPLFIYGGSGLGKTHLLRAIQNYIAECDPDRTCVYRPAGDFVNDYVTATRAKGAVIDTLATNYKGVDVLIIDDIQQLMGKQSTVAFFFDVFNDLVRRGKQVVLAADEPPVQLGFDDRDLSRMGMGAVVGIQAPTLEFKRVLVHTFYERMKTDGMAGTITDENLDRIGDRSGNNIRLIRAFVLDCLLKADRLEQEGHGLTGEDIDEIAGTRFEPAWKRVTPEEVQRAVQKRFGISHEDLVSQKRSKEIAQPRHIAIYLTRELTGLTLKEIGGHYGGRTHPTIKNSIAWVEEHMRTDRILYDKVRTIRESLGG